MDQSRLEYKAQDLLSKVIYECQNCTQSSHTLAAYDTAWVSMIIKTVDGNSYWAFPECFQWVIDGQQRNGGWEAANSREDGILNTMAALLAMKRHQSQNVEPSPTYCPDLAFRIEQAVQYLQSKLLCWDVEASMHVGFEIIVPMLLSLLEREQIFFQFSKRQVLIELKEKKLKHFYRELVCGDRKTTLLHSLEAFIGEIDFDGVRHHLTSGSLMGSPSSTAAYLMNCSVWDAEAESYLRDAILRGAGNGKGGVPSVYPCNFFELTWVQSRSISEWVSQRT